MRRPGRRLAHPAFDNPTHQIEAIIRADSQFSVTEGRQMARQEFSKAYWKLQLYGNLASFAALIAFVGAAVILEPWGKPIVVRFGNILRNYFKDEGIVGLLGGLAIGAVLIPCFLLLMLPLIWVNHRLGVICPNCRRSLTLRCREAEVLRTGQSCACNELLFKATEAD